MIRALSFLLFGLLFDPIAGAWCSLPPPATASSAPPVQLAPGPLLCMPTVAGIVGSGRGYLARDFPALPGATTYGGSAWGWWCQAPDQTWRAQTVACLDRYCPGSAAKAVVAALAAPQPLIALQAALDGYAVRLTDWAETHDYNCLHANMRAALQATKPSGTSAPVWRTPSGGSSIYPVTAGRLGPPIAGRRAPGSAPCDLALLKITSGAYTYGALSGGTAAEAVLCVQAPQ
jgi:hypothetical protein